MNRRSLLAGGGLAIASPLAGCRAPGTSPAVPEYPSKYPVSSRGTVDYYSSGTYETHEIGDRSGVDDAYEPYPIVVWNAAGVPEVELILWDVIDEVDAYSETHEIPEDEDLELVLLEPSKYLVRVRVPDTETQHTVRVPCGFFDCYSIPTTIGILAADEIESDTGLVPLISCPSYSSWEC